jgi:hypothetical protein
MRHVGEHVHALDAPAGQVRNEDIRFEMQLGLGEDPPAAGSSSAETERPAKA